MGGEIETISQYLTFILNGESFAIDISQTLEVLEFTQVTKVPRTPEFMLGVINLRGGVIPVIDMRTKFNMPVLEHTVETSIVIIEIKLEDEKTVLGAVVDSVQEVLDIESSNVEVPPKIGTRLKVEYIKGMAKYNGQFIILLNIEKVFSLEELSLMQASAPVGATA